MPGHWLTVTCCLLTLAACWGPITWQAWRSMQCDPATAAGWAACRVGW